MSQPDLVIIPNVEYPHLAQVWEPLPTKAPSPSTAQPYCCYGDTVIFYLRPYVVRPWHHFWICNRKRKASPPGHMFEEWDRVETNLRIDALITHQGQQFRCYNGRVVWKHKRWWMLRDARRERV